MVKRLTNVSSYRVSYNGADHIVVLERINNDVNGNPRYKAQIIFLEVGYISYYTAVYTFGGYFADFEAADHIVKEHYRRANK